MLFQGLRLGLTGLGWLFRALFSSCAGSLRSCYVCCRAARARAEAERRRRSAGRRADKDTRELEKGLTDDKGTKDGPNPGADY